MKNEELFVEVLLVAENSDDSKITINALKEGNKKMRLLHLKDGEDALNFIFAKKHYENQKIQNDLKLVLLDLKLPKIDGLEILRKIREDKRTKTLPVVIITSAKDRDIAEAYNHGVNSYVVKNKGIDIFFKTISTLGFYWTVLNENPVQ